MNLIARLAALVASLCIAMTCAPAPAHADTTPVVVSADINVLADTCFPEIVRISGLYESDDSDRFYEIETDGPQGFVPGGSLLWHASTRQDLVLGWCSTDLPTGHYVVTVDGVERGSFNAYRPVLDVLSVVPPVGSARMAHRQPRKATAMLTLRGAPLPNTAVTVRNRYAGTTHLSTVLTNSAGQAKARCPRSRTCRVSFGYDPLHLSTPTVKVRKR